MSLKPKKTDFPTSQVRRYLEPGPIVLVSSAHDGRRNIMTMGWHTVMEFTPSLVGCVISSANHSFEMIRQSRECVINLPTTKLTDIVVGIGNTTGAEIDKFEHFGLTAEKAERVGAPLIAECHASFECRLHDDGLVGKYNFFIFEVVKAHVAASPIRPGAELLLTELEKSLQFGMSICFASRRRLAGGPLQVPYRSSRQCRPRFQCSKRIRRQLSRSSNLRRRSTSCGRRSGAAACSS